MPAEDSSTAVMVLPSPKTPGHNSPMVDMTSTQ
jgi:hypothetical protein